MSSFKLAGPLVVKHFPSRSCERCKRGRYALAHESVLQISCTLQVHVQEAYFCRIVKSRASLTNSLFVAITSDVGSFILEFVEVKLLCSLKRTAKFFRMWIEDSLGHPRRVICEGRKMSEVSFWKILDLCPQITAFSTILQDRGVSSYSISFVLSGENRTETFSRVRRVSDFSQPWWMSNSTNQSPPPILPLP